MSGVSEISIVVARGRLAVLTAHLTTAASSNELIEVAPSLEPNCLSAQASPPGNLAGSLTVVDGRTGEKYQVPVSEDGTVKATDLKKLADWGFALSQHSAVPQGLLDIIQAMPHDAHPMGVLVSAMSALSIFHPDANPALRGQDLYQSKQVRDKQIARVIGKAPTIAAAAYLRLAGRPPVLPSSNLSFAENFLFMLDSLGNRTYKPNPRLARVLDILFILHAEHEMNCSTAAARHLASGGVDVYTALAQCGDVDTLYVLIQEDAYLLDHIDHVPFFDTPSHISVCNGHKPFVMEMVRLKPSFARKPNLEGFSPIHLALQYKHTEMVNRLLQVNGDLIRIKGREGITPLHYAVIVDGQLDLLAEFLSVCPNSIKDVTTRKTVLYIALKYDKLEAFKFFVEWIRHKRSKNSIFWERKILNWKNEEGNTILHIAISKNQPESVRLLLKFGVDINAKNLRGHTAGDILAEQTQVENNNEIRVMLQRAGALLANSSLLDYNYSRYLLSIVSSLEESLIHCSREWRIISEDKRDALLVVATLLITKSYEGVLNPPRGIWQEDSSRHGTHTHWSNAMKPNLCFNKNATLPEKIAGTPIGLRLLPFWLFLASNSVTFMFSYLTILLLIPFEYDMLCIAFFSLSFCYFASLTVIVPNPIWYCFRFIYVGLLLIFLLTAIWLIKSRLLKRYVIQ